MTLVPSSRTTTRRSQAEAARSGILSGEYSALGTFRWSSRVPSAERQATATNSDPAVTLGYHQPESRRNRSGTSRSSCSSATGCVSAFGTREATPEFWIARRPKVGRIELREASPSSLVSGRFRSLRLEHVRTLPRHCATLRGAGRIRTAEWRFCRPLPYHLATAPEMQRGRGQRRRPLQSGKPDSNRRPPPWQGGALPTELFPRELP